MFVFNGFVMVNRKILVIPEAARQDVLQELHAAHKI